MVQNFRFPMVASLSAVAVTVGFTASANALTLNRSSGTWGNVTGGGITVERRTVNTIDGLENQVRWGRSQTQEKSGFGFTGTVQKTFEIGEPFLLGTFRHYNNSVLLGSAATATDLTITLDLAELSSPTSFSFSLGIDETPNDNSVNLLRPRLPSQPWIAGQTCKYYSLPDNGTPTSCPDRVFITGTPPINESVEIGGRRYTLEWYGLSSSPNAPQLIPGLTEEGGANVAPIYVFGRLVDVDNQTPEVSPDPDDRPPARDIFEGDLFSFTAPSQGRNNDLSFEWDLDNDGLFDDFAGPEGKWVYQQDGNYPVRLRTFDGRNEQISSFDINVLNAAPTITSLTNNLTVKTNELFDFFADATDPGIFDILSFDWDLNGDGLFDDFTGTRGQWSFADPGTFDVAVRVSDGDGGETFGSFKVEAVPEPSSVLGLFVLGAFGVGFRRQKRHNA